MPVVDDGWAEAPDDPDLLRALLAAARAERDRQFLELVEAHEWINSMLASPAYRAGRRAARVARKVRRRRAQGEAQPARTGSDGAAEGSGSEAAHPPAPAMPLVRAGGGVTAPVSPGALMIDATPLDEQMRSGIARVTVRLAQELARAARPDKHPRPRWSWCARLPGGSGRTCRWREVFGAKPGRGATPGADATAAFVSACVPPAERADEWWAGIAGYPQPGGLYVQIIHDLLPITVPDFFDQGLRGYFPQWLQRVAGAADVIVSVSEATASDLERWLAAQEVPTASHRLVVRNGADVPGALKARWGRRGDRWGGAVGISGGPEGPPQPNAPDALGARGAADAAVQPAGSSGHSPAQVLVVGRSGHAKAWRR